MIVGTTMTMTAGRPMMMTVGTTMMIVGTTMTMTAGTTMMMIVGKMMTMTTAGMTENRECADALDARIALQQKPCAI